MGKPPRREEAWTSVRRAASAHSSLADDARTAPGRGAHGQEPWEAQQGYASGSSAVGFGIVMG